MKSIEIDEQVFAELARRATGFHVSPNDVLRGILQLEPADAEHPRVAITSADPGTRAPLVLFVQSPAFQHTHQAIERYLRILGWLFAESPKEVSELLLGFRRGERRYFAKSEREIENGGRGVSAKSIPKTPLWALATLDNKTKRFILEDVLRHRGYSPGDIKAVLDEIPDSEIRRRREFEQY